MAGYFSKLVGNVYDGSFNAGEDLQNGMFVMLSNGEVVTTDGVKNTIMRVADKTSKWGLPFVVLDVVSVGTHEVFFTENEWDINDSDEYDTSLYTIKEGSAVKMKRPLPGEQLYMSVSDILYAALSVGDMVNPTTNGVIAEVL